jgi:prephenate dehydrogenase
VSPLFPPFNNMFALKDSRIAIMGLGLMGGSIALALKGHCDSLIGFDPDPAALSLALHQKIVDQADSDPAKLLPSADLVILAAPVPAILTLLEQLPAFTPNPCIVLDLGSTKRAIVERMNALPERFDPIGGHPICGKENLTLANAEKTLYYDAPFILVPLPRSTSRARSAADQVVAVLGAQRILLDPEEHDRLLSSTSHLPFLLASALVLTVPDKCAPLIGPGFRSASRLAGTPASMMLGVLQTNRKNILVALHYLQAELSSLESALNLGDYATLEASLDRAREKYNVLLAVR